MKKPKTEVRPHQRLMGGAIGSVVEIFDFSVYALTAPALAIHFFPKGDPAAALLATFAVFAAAFFARPLGGVLFGILGDRLGRMRILSLTVLMMGGATLLTGLLPSYAAIGIAAPILLVICRLVQGLSLGGESSGGYTYVIESAPDNKRGKWIGIVIFALYFPTAFLSLMIVGISGAMGDSAYMDWGWRVPFVIGGVIAAVGFWLRLRLDDPEEFKAAAAVEKVTVKDTMRGLAKSWKSIGRILLLQAPQTAAAYLLIGYMFTFVVTHGHLSQFQAQLTTGASVLLLACLGPVFGSVSDRVGRKPVLAAGFIWLVLMAYPAFALASNGTVIGALLGQCLLAIGVALINSAFFVIAVEVFPTNVRYAGHGLAFNLAAAIFGGTTPLVATALVTQFGTPVAPAFYAIGLALTLGLVGFLLTPETRYVSLRHSLLGDPENSASDSSGDTNVAAGAPTAPDSPDLTAR
ncbi:MFS transporter [Arthrobacter sp. BE255]|uniref:MFS transporter n=1 Tax=Arthrobacter sp. BE255 TaxID=2817721 RepID=UPI0028643735|nr:MFS transporter [Arthrobacter sp. BE255]MDR7161939.1 MHS family proline/betaine transporter-like MFS transporter [Arthrobacter sp. BE255]